MNLDKLRAFELPFAEKEFYIAGEFQKFKIYAMHESVGIAFSEIDMGNADGKVKAIQLALTDCLRISEEDAKLICDVDFDVAGEIFKVASEITKDYHARRKAERENAIKKFNLAQGANTVG